MKTLRLFCVVLLGSSAGAASGQESVLKMPKDQNMFFKASSYTDSKYIQFRANGTYRRISRSHFLARENDHGTWSQSKKGEITLLSQEHYRNIECDPLEIFTWHRETADLLPALKESISDLLSRSSAESFTSAEIKNNRLSLILGDPRVKAVKREQLESLLRRINEFINDPEKNRFHLTPMTYKGMTFLLWRDSETPINRNLARIKEAIDKSKNGRCPTHIFLAVDKETFEKESKKTQEFIVFPEMNKRIRQKQERK